MTWRLSLTLPEGEPISTKAYNAATREPRIGVMIHYDASASDASAVSWLGDNTCRVSYNDLVVDDGTIHRNVSWDSRAWHAGVCRPSDERLKYRDANSAFIGIAAATNPQHVATEAQRLSIAILCRNAFRTFGWQIDEMWRIVGHDTQGWPRNRKHDPTGKYPGLPIVDIDAIRYLVTRLQ